MLAENEDYQEYLDIVANMPKGTPLDTMTVEDEKRVARERYPMRAFLDTNFLLDCVLPGRPEHGAAQTTKGLVDVGLIEGVVSACSLKDAYYILTKQAGEARAGEVVRDCLRATR